MHFTSTISWPKLTFLLLLVFVSDCNPLSQTFWFVVEYCYIKTCINYHVNFKRILSLLSFILMMPARTFLFFRLLFFIGKIHSLFQLIYTQVTLKNRRAHNTKWKPPTISGGQNDWQSQRCIHHRCWSHDFQICHQPPVEQPTAIDRPSQARPDNYVISEENILGGIP